MVVTARRRAGCVARRSVTNREAVPGARQSSTTSGVSGHGRLDLGSDLPFASLSSAPARAVFRLAHLLDRPRPARAPTVPPQSFSAAHPKIRPECARSATQHPTVGQSTLRSPYSRYYRSRLVLDAARAPFTSTPRVSIRPRPSYPMMASGSSRLRCATTPSTRRHTLALPSARQRVNAFRGMQVCAARAGGREATGSLEAFHCTACARRKPNGSNPEGIDRGAWQCAGRAGGWAAPVRR